MALFPTYAGYDQQGSSGTGLFGRVRQSARTPNYDPLGRGGPGGLRDLLERYFLPELSNQQGRRGPIENAFNSQALEPGALYGAASTAAQGVAGQLFAPGGEVAKMIAQARGGTIGQGFSPDSAWGGENNILRSATSRVADTFATTAAGLEGQRFGALTEAYGGQQQSIRDLLESLFTGVGSSEQLGLANKASQKKFLGIF